jgi:hypothetical protein
MTVYPVSGKLLVGGRPAERAEVSLHPLVPFSQPEARSTLPYGLVRGDGSFTIGTYTTDDGAPPGEYALTAVWPKVTLDGGEESLGPDRLGKAFSDPKKPITKITVSEGANVIPPIDLKGNVPR